MRAIQLYIELVLLVMLMVGGLIFIPPFLREIDNPAVKFYDDKTIIHPNGEVVGNSDKIQLITQPNGRQEYCQVYDGKMVGLMLLIQDEFCPINNIKINGQNYNIGENWQFDRYELIETTYNTVLKPIMNTKLLVKYKPCDGRWTYYINSLGDKTYKYFKKEGDYWIFSN